LRESRNSALEKVFRFVGVPIVCFQRVALKKKCDGVSLLLAKSKGGSGKSENRTPTRNRDLEKV
jgi:hypothetical protein